MIKSKFDNIKIVGIATAVPSSVVKSEDLYEKYGEEEIKKISALSGVKEKRQSVDRQLSSDLGYVAAKKILDEKKIDSSSIGLMIYVTQTPDYRMPATAFVLQKRLGLSKNCMVFDINLGCSGYVIGLHVLCSILSTINSERALLIAGESTKFQDYETRTNALIFGDGTSATLIEKVECASEIEFYVNSNGSHYSDIITPGSFYRGMTNKNNIDESSVRNAKNMKMNGVNVFTFTITDVVKLIKKYLQERNEDMDDYDGLVLHQANLFLLQKMAKKLKLSEEKLLISIDRYGNTSSASIPITLVDHYGEFQDKTVKCLMSGFGVGLSWAVMNAEISTNDIFPMIESDFFYDDIEIENNSYSE